MSRPTKTMGRLLAGVTATLAVTSGLALTAAPAMADEHNVVSGQQYYLALGDSWGQMVSPAVYQSLHDANPDLGFVRLACGGENSYGMVTPGASKAWLGEDLHTGGCSNDPTRDEYSSVAAGHSNQLSAALDFISTHPGQVRFITISIGGNDAGDPSIATGANIVSAVRQLRAAAGQNAKIVGANFPDLTLAQWLNGPSGQSAAQASLTTIKNINDWVAARYTEGGGDATADIAGALNTFTPLSTTSTWNGQTVPLAVATLCTYTRMCTENNGHPNSAGDQLLANQIVTQVFGESKELPSPLPPPAAPTKAPATPTGLTVYGAQRGTLELTWNPPATNGVPVSGYKVEQSVDSGDWTKLSADTGNPSTRYTVTGLTGNSSYRFRITAINSKGSSEPTEATAGIGAPTDAGAPRSVNATLSSYQGTPYVNLTWSAPATDGGSPIVGYQIDRSSNNGDTWVSQKGGLDPSTRSYVITGMTAGVKYIYRVRVNTAISWGPNSASTAPIIVATVPSQPTGVQGVPFDHGADVTWAAASDRGSPVTGYLVEAANKSVSPRVWTSVANVDAGTTSTRVTGLTNGTPYVFRVTAFNALGASQPSGESPKAATPQNAPGAPTAVTASAGRAQATVSWTAPAANGGPAVAGYRVEQSSDGADTWSLAQDSIPAATKTITISGLTNGISYVFRVIAVNAMGSSMPSAVSAAVVPVQEPDSPTEVQAAAGDQQAQVQWNVPNSNGSAITSYTVAVSGDNGQTWNDIASSNTNSATVTGLTNDAGYLFRVVAVNDVGLSQPSAASALTTPVSPFPKPDASVITAGDVVAAKAQLRATVNANGSPAQVWFEFGSDPSLSDSVTVAAAKPNIDGTDPVAETGQVRNLIAGTAYYYRVVVQNAGHRITSAIMPFTTLKDSTAVTKAAASVTASSATLRAAVTANGTDLTSVEFVYSTDPQFSAGVTVVSSIEAPTNRTASMPYSVALTGLAANTTYYFKVRATNVYGTVESLPSSLTTKAK